MGEHENTNFKDIEGFGYKVVLEVNDNGKVTITLIEFPSNRQLLVRVRFVRKVPDVKKKLIQEEKI